MNQTDADASDQPPTRVRVLVTEPVPQELVGGRQASERRDVGTTPRKAADESLALGDAVAGNAGLSCGLPFDPLDVPPAPADQPS